MLWVLGMSYTLSMTKQSESLMLWTFTGIIASASQYATLMYMLRKVQGAQEAHQTLLPNAGFWGWQVGRWLRSGRAA